ncbi:4-carboxymuconolactone decarboxylase [Colletotrichum cuscutae]|uniref:4-carboxymuconolactone decarboxylase n=1 Tax=Colletotrichum cuscutae TaxID=1209917 RepID=A0AAI9U2W3_9PEZI|nr:4-carboxymuconolactone decarboxylase [Colletotrichum cuscutae]
MCENMDILSQNNDTRDEVIFQDDALGSFGQMGEDFDDINSFMDLSRKPSRIQDCNKIMSEPSERLVQGAQMAQAVLGAKLLSAIQEQARDDLPSKVSAEYIAEVCFSSYARPGLEFKESSLVNIGMMIALNRTPELRIHIAAALNLGISEEKIVETCRHAMIYCGVPAGREALAVASDIFAKVRGTTKEERAKMS